MEIELKMDVGKSRKQSRRMKQMEKEVASGKKPTLQSLKKGRK
jgi:hypothetical protein